MTDRVAACDSFSALVQCFNQVQRAFLVHFDAHFNKFVERNTVKLLIAADIDRYGVVFRLFISENHIENLREDAGRLSLDADRICRETDASRTMEGIYIKVEENGEVVDRMKYVRASFLQTVEESQSHWLDRPIIPNRITKAINELFL